MAQILKNNVSGVLALALGASATSMTLLDASSFPTPPEGDFYLLTLIGLNANGQESNWEVVKVTGKASNTLIVVRAQEGTTAAAWPVATIVQMRLTAGSVVTPDAVAAHIGSGGSTHAAATTSAAGFMSAADKTKLDGVAPNANNYIHPTEDGNLHVPATGTSNAGKVLTAGATPGSASWQDPQAAGLQYLTEVRNTTAPNATVPIHGIRAASDEASIDLLLQQKGFGAIIAQVPDGTAAGGNKRGANAVDLQTVRTANTHVASGANSVVAGGSGNRATTTGAVVVGGSSNAATANYAFTGGGLSNSASGQYSCIAGGISNAASGTYSTASGGIANTASGHYSTIPGGKNATTNGILGLLAYGFNAASQGQIQMAFWGGHQYTNSTNTPTRITSDAGSGSAANQLTLRSYSAFRIKGTVVACDTTSKDCKEWTFEALIKRGANAAATAIVGTPTIASTFADAAAGSWSIDVTADTTNGALAVTAIGEAGKTIRWTAVVHSIEVA